MWLKLMAIGAPPPAASLSGCWASPWRSARAAFLFGSFGSNAGKPHPDSNNPLNIMQMHLPEYFFGDLVATVAFGLVAILLIILGYVVFDRLTTKLDFDDLLN